MLTQKGSARQNRHRVAIAATVAVVTVAALSGCSNPDPVLARLQNGGVVFMICEQAAVSEVLISVAAKDTVDYESTWDISGERTIEKGDELVYGKPWPGWQETSPSIPIDVSNSGISIVIGNSPLPDKARFSATFAGWKLSDSQWTDSQGNKFEKCE